MAIITTPEETKRILEGKSDAVTRPYPGGSPYKPGDEITLSFDGKLVGKPGKLIHYAVVKVMTVRPTTLQDRLGGSEAFGLAKGEGFTNESAWGAHFRRNFGAFAGRVHRVRFAVVRLEKSIAEAVKNARGNHAADGRPTNTKRQQVATGGPGNQVQGRGPNREQRPNNSAVVFAREVTLSENDEDFEDESTGSESQYNSGNRVMLDVRGR